MKITLKTNERRKIGGHRMKSIFVLSTMWIFFFAIPLQAYIILDSKTEVSPGCEGGVLSRKSTSFTRDLDQLNSDEFDPDSDEFDSDSDEFDCLFESLNAAS
jgi:hypothetical protein